jgi:sec-independent protein translocase protein TatC
VIPRAMDETRLPLTDHLAELRTRIIRILLAWVIGSIAAWSYSDEIFALLLAPAVHALGKGQSLQAIAPSEIFFSYVKCALLAGFVFALPVIFWQIWAFVAPGLYANEKKAILPFVLVSTLLFVGGAVFGYTEILPTMFAFFSSYDSELVKSAWSMHEAFKLTTHMFLAFGLAFELPVFVFFLAVAGIVDAPTLLRGTRYAVLAIFVAAAVLTPSPDWVSQVMLGVPMVVLYLIGVAVAFAFGPKRGEAAAGASSLPATQPAASRDRAGPR